MRGNSSITGELPWQKPVTRGIFSNGNIWISIKISLNFVPKGPVNNIPALVQIIAGSRPGDKPLDAYMHHLAVMSQARIGGTFYQIHWLLANLLLEKSKPESRIFETSRDLAVNNGCVLLCISAWMKSVVVVWINTLIPRQHGRDFASDIFKLIKITEFWFKCHWNVCSQTSN